MSEKTLLNNEFELREKAYDAAFAIMTCPDTTCSRNEAIEHWDSGQNHPDCMLWQPFENMNCEELLETFDMLVESHMRFLNLCLGK